MADFLDEVLDAHAPRVKAPDAKSPGAFTFKSNPITGEGEASYVFGPDDRDTSFDAILAKMLPDVPVRAIEVLEVRAWGDPASPYQYVKTRVRQPRGADHAEAHERLMSDVRKRRKRKRATTAVSDATLVVVPADRQIGKSYERGGGSRETYDRCMDEIGKVQDRWRDLRRSGVPLGDLVLSDGGDATEGYCGYYDNQLFTIDMNEAEQVETVAAIHDASIDAWSALPGLSTLEVTGVTSNHDRPREGGKYVTDPSDSRLFTILRSLARAYGKNPDRYEHVTFTLPKDPRVAVLERHGRYLGFIHGDQAQKFSGPASKKVWDWWTGQIGGGQGVCPAAVCDTLVSSHYHHYFSLRQQGRVLYGTPTGDVGSQYLTDERGIWSSPGLLTFVVDSTGAHSERVL